MDLRNYFQKIKEVEATIAELFTLIVSFETGDGGKAGTHTEVPRALAAKMIVAGLARLASDAEKRAFYGQKQPLEAPAKPVEAPAKK